MTALLTLFLLLAAPVPTSLDQVKAEPNPERRARAAVDFAVASEKAAEADFASGDMKALAAELNTMKESMETARDSLVASGKTPGRNPGPYKYAELHARDLLIRLEDLEQRMFLDDRPIVDGPKASVQEIHDAWFDGIMGKKR